MALHVTILKAKIVRDDYNRYHAIKVRARDTINNTQQVLWLSFDHIPTSDEVGRELTAVLEARKAAALEAYRFQALVGQSFTVET